MTKGKKEVKNERTNKEGKKTNRKKEGRNFIKLETNAYSFSIFD